MNSLLSLLITQSSCPPFSPLLLPLLLRLLPIRQSLSVLPLSLLVLLLLFTDYCIPPISFSFQLSEETLFDALLGICGNIGKPKPVTSN
jgi:hypothetical protein